MTLHWLTTGTDSLKTLVEDCYAQREMIVLCLKNNAAMQTIAKQQLDELERGRDDSYWYSLKVGVPGCGLFEG